MTLIWTVASPQCVVHVSDRLVTLSTGGVLSPAANKNVVYHGRDCLVTIGFTGLAALESLPVDTWIAREILGTAVEGTYIGRIQGARVHRISELVRLIRNGVRRAFHGAEHRHVQMVHTIVVGGWRWNSKGETRPFVSSIEKARGESEAVVKHHLGRRMWLRGQYSLTAFGTLALEQREVQELNASVGAAINDPERVAELLAEATRVCAARSPGVGAHCMTSVIPVPHGQFDAKVRLVSDREAPEPPLYYTPWIILGNGLAAPPTTLWTREVTDEPGLVFSNAQVRITTYR